MRSTGSRRRRVPWWLGLAAGSSLWLGACALGDAPDEGLTLFAASSLRAVSTELEAAWAAAEPDVPLTIATEASNVLAARIREGAHADIFISADDIHPRQLAEEGLTFADPISLAQNEVTLVARPDGPVTEAADLALPGTLIVVGGPSTPIGRYTELALQRLAGTMTDARTFATAVAANIASREDNVRATLAKVELGEGDAAFVYRTDALGSEDVVRIGLPEEARVGVTYTAVQVAEGPLAAEFMAWLGSPIATDILEEAGFEVPA